MADLPIGVESEVLEWDGDRAVVETTIHIETPDLAIGVGPDGASQFTLEVHAALMDRELDLVDELHREVHLPAVASLGRQGPPRGLVYRHRWRLPSGEYDLRIMIYDTISGRVGALSESVAVVDQPR